MKVLAFGEVMMRLMVPDHKLLSQSEDLKYIFSGTGVNILSGLYQMGYETYLASKLPNNNVGYAAGAYLRKLGVKDDYINFGGNYIGIYFLETGFGARATEVTYMNRQNSAFCQSTMEDYDFDKILQDIDAVHICGISLALNDNTRKLSLELAKKAYEKNIRIFFDFNYRPSLWGDKDYSFAKTQYEEILKYCSVVFAGYKDASLILGIEPYKDEKEDNIARNVLLKMRSKYNIHTICGTYRSIESSDHQYIKGYLIDANGYHESSEYELKILDRIGAGDGFAAGIIYSLLENLNTSEALEFATCSAVLAHTTYGDSPVVSKKSIYRLMQKDKTDIFR